MGNNSSSELPLAAIICLAFVGYIALILIIVLIRFLCVRKGVCQNVECGICGKENDPRCSECCVNCNDSCGCNSPSLEGCLRSCCPNKKASCVDILLCQCCLGENNCFTNRGDESYATCCVFDFSCPECNAINCCCFEIKLRNSTTAIGSLIQTNNQSNFHFPQSSQSQRSFYSRPSKFEEEPIQKQPSALTEELFSSPPSVKASNQREVLVTPSKQVVTSQIHVNRAFDMSCDENNESLSKESTTISNNSKRRKQKIKISSKQTEPGSMDTQDTRKETLTSESEVISEINEVKPSASNRPTPRPRPSKRNSKVSTNLTNAADVISAPTPKRVKKKRPISSERKSMHISPDVTNSQSAHHNSPNITSSSDIFASQPNTSRATAEHRLTKLPPRSPRKKKDPS